METHSYGYLPHSNKYFMFVIPSSCICLQMFILFTFLTAFCGLLNQIKAPFHLLNRRRDVLVIVTTCKRLTFPQRDGGHSV